MRVFLASGAAMILTFALAGCAEEPLEKETAVPPAPISVPEIPETEPAPEPIAPSAVAPVGYDEIGEVSYYSDALQGRLTASEEPYDIGKFTAAHRTLPFGSIVRVTNISNGKSTGVRVNDRGPFAHNRILDLSRAAAEKVDLITTGHADMRVTVVRDENGTIVNQQLWESSKGHLEAPFADDAAE